LQQFCKHAKKSREKYLGGKNGGGGAQKMLKIPAGLQLFNQYEVEMSHDELGICPFVTKTTLHSCIKASFLFLYCKLD